MVLKLIKTKDDPLLHAKAALFLYPCACSEKETSNNNAGKETIKVWFWLVLDLFGKELKQKKPFMVVDHYFNDDAKTSKKRLCSKQQV